jgi:metal-responsive CopG/Arc/MetJ family transcriptional regulator
MAYKKTAIAVPEDLLAEVDLAARKRGESRSRYITAVLRAAVRAKRDADITRRLNELFADESINDAQSKTAEQLDDAGTEWTDERW